MAKTFFMLAGEASGDLHASNLILALKAQEPESRFVGLGGPLMQAAGLDVAKDLEGMQVMGIVEVVKHYGFFRNVFFQLLDRLKAERPAALICVDYPGFNLRFAKEVRKLGIPILYYIVPQVWAWKPKRAAKMAEIVDRAYCVFEFEPPFFDCFKSPARRMKTRFVGHPILDSNTLKPPGLDLSEPDSADAKTVGFLPGSRAAEIAQHQSPMREGFRIAQKKMRGLRALWSQPLDYPNEMAGAPREIMVTTGDPDHREGNKQFLYGSSNGSEHPKWIDRKGMTAEALSAFRPGKVSHASLVTTHADYSVVKSGTSALEAGLQGRPMCVVYRAGQISYSIAQLLVDLPVYSLVNIVMGRYVVPELIQSEVNGARIAQEIELGLTDRAYIENQKKALAELPGKLGGPGASQRTAGAMLGFLNGNE